MAKDILVDNKFIYNLEYNFIHYFGVINKVAFVCFCIGILNVKPDIILKIAFFIKILIGLFLVYRFNNWRSDKIIFTDLDRKASYSAGIFIILISFSDLILRYIDDIRSFIIPYTKPIIEKIPVVNHINDLI
uniref:Uncharacterized protein n=1 Tax=viral metagenome TaxID=1070528 RepID=A0A6C0DUK7_9ZZZZ